MADDPLPQANELFRRYLAARNQDEDPEDLLARLVVDFAQPLVGRVVRRRLSSVRDVNPQDVEDVCSEALSVLVPRLRDLRTSHDAATVWDFGAYVAGLASHVAFKFFAARFPERSRLRNRLRYVLTSDARFRMWRADGGRSVCALARLGDCPVLSGAALEPFRQTIGARPYRVSKLPDLLFAVLTDVPGAVEVGDLTSIIGPLAGVDDRAEAVENAAEALVDSRPSHSRQFELRESLCALWSDVMDLPVPQKVALLLNLRTTGGAGAWLLTELGVVSFRELAVSLGLTAEALAGLWNRLPLEDLEIAKLLSLERQQVINLRSAARQRLGRRSRNRDRTPEVANTLRNSSTN
jgi:hypothetical protein